MRSDGSGGGLTQWHSTASRWCSVHDEPAAECWSAECLEHARLVVSAPVHPTRKENTMPNTTHRATAPADWDAQRGSYLGRLGDDCTPGCDTDDQSLWCRECVTAGSDYADTDPA